MSSTSLPAEWIISPEATTQIEVPGRDNTLKMRSNLFWGVTGSGQTSRYAVRVHERRR
jgi:hypothetical protein